MKNDKTVMYGVAALAVVGGYFFIKSKILQVIPDVVEEGVEAGATLIDYAAHAIYNPFDAFGISPDWSSVGVPNWQHTLPWQNPDDPVSNGAGGMNYNYF